MHAHTKHRSNNKDKQKKRQFIQNSTPPWNDQCYTGEAFSPICIHRKKEKVSKI